MMFYVIPMYVAGITEGMMWKQFTKDGFLQYPNFLEIVTQVLPMYRLRAIGGSLYITGVVLMLINLYRTARSGKFVPEVEAQAAALVKETPDSQGRKKFHHWLESKAGLFTILAVVAILIGGLVEIVPPVCHQGKCADHRQRETLHAAAGARAGHLHPRRLPCLPLADDPPVPLGNRALRRIFQGRRVHLRPSVPLGIEAHRARPPPRRRKISRRLALQSHGKSARHLARLHHAELRLAPDAEAGHGCAAVAAQGAAQGGGALSRGFENGPAQKDLQAEAATIVQDLKAGMVSAYPDGTAWTRRTTRSSR